MSDEEKIIKVEGEITERELKELLNHIALRSMRIRRRGGWTPVEKIAMKLFSDEIQAHFAGDTEENA